MGFVSFLKHRRKAVITGLTGILLFGCSDKTNPLETEISEIKIPENVEVLSEKELRDLSSYSDGIFVFNVEKGTLEIGDILAGGISEKTPSGFLRKVTYISKDKKTIRTVQSNLEEAIENGAFEFRRKLSPGVLKAVPGVFQKPSSSGFDLRIENVVLYDADGNSNTKNDQINMNGNISLGYKICFEMGIENFSLRKLRFENNVSESANLKLTGNASLEKINKRIEIAKYECEPIVISLPTPIPLPVVFTPKISVNVGIDGKVLNSVEVNVKQSANLTAGVAYENFNWSNLNDFSHGFDFGVPSFSNEANVRGFAGPRLEMEVYGVAESFFEMNGFGRLDADVHRTPSWKIFGGLEAIAGVYAKILGHTLADYSVKVIDFEKLLGESKPEKKPNFLVYDDGSAEKTLGWACLENKSPVLFFSNEGQPTWGWYGNGELEKIQNPVANNKYGMAVSFAPDSKVKIKKLIFYLKNPQSYGGDILANGFYLHLWDSGNKSLFSKFIPRNEINYGWWERNVSENNFIFNRGQEFKVGLCQAFLPYNEMPSRPTFLGADTSSTGHSYTIINGRICRNDQLYSGPNEHYELMIRVETESSE